VFARKTECGSIHGRLSVHVCSEAISEQFSFRSFFMFGVLKHTSNYLTLSQ
jgi:hypothetical protein